MTNAVSWQGTCDALCGIYCAAHLIACYAVMRRSTQANQLSFYKKESEKAFHHLLFSMEDKELLTAQKLSIRSRYGGLTDRQIEAVFNNLAPENRENLTALAFSRPQLSKLTNTQHREILSNGACAIVHEHGKDHWISAADEEIGEKWVTVEGRHRDGGYCCFDPDLRKNTKRRTRLRWDKGVFIGPPESLTF